jgi:hypothetical protein
MYVIPLENGNVWSTLIKDKINKLHHDGYICLTLDSDDEMSISLELAKLWGGEIKRCENFVIIKNNINFDVTPEVWYRRSIRRILNNEIPRYRVKLPKNLINPDNVDTYEDGDLDEEDFIRLKYIAILSYINLTDTYIDLLDRVNSVQFFDDLTVEADFYTYNQVIQFQKLLRSQVLPGVQVHLVKNLYEAIYLREKLNEKVYESMIIPQDDKIFVITNAPSSESETSFAIPSGISEKYINFEDSLEIRGYFNWGSIKGVKEYKESPELTVPSETLEIYETSGTSGVLSVSVTIPSKDFWAYNSDIDYMTPEEIVNYDLEISLKENVYIYTSNDKIFNLYEGLESSEKVKEMWKTGFFLNNWGKYIYKKYNKFSRAPPLYFV